MKTKTVLIICVCVTIAAMAGHAQAPQDQLTTSEFQVTFDSGGHSTPMIGKDAIGDLIVYSQYPIVNGQPGNASIYYQRVANGAPFGPEIVVANSPQNQWLEDVSGDNIVYTLSPSIGTYGDIILYQISTAQARRLTTAGNAWEPRIFGDFVVWIEMTATGGQLVWYQISSGTPVRTTLLAGPTPSVAEGAIGDRFVVWSQFANGHFQIAAYDMQRQLSIAVASDAQADLRVPSTSGSWIAWESRKGTGVDIDAVNMDTMEYRSVASNGALNQRPHVSGDLLAYESSVSGRFQIYLYRLGERDTFKVTNSAYAEHLNDVLGTIVTYIDSRNGNDGVFASSLWFSSPQAPLVVSPSPVNFGSVSLGAVSQAQTITLSINANLTLSSVQAGGDYSIVSNSCALHVPIASGTNCALSVQFTPGAPGQRWFPLTVTDSNSNALSVGLEGTGVGSALAFTPGIVTTLAGTGAPGYNGDNGAAATAKLWTPFDAVADSAGNVYIADTDNHRIRKVDASGVITTVAGDGTAGFGGDGGPATSAQLHGPIGVTIDSAGNLYIADSDNNRVRKVDAGGTITTIAGDGTDSVLNLPTGLAVDGAGNVYVADDFNWRIRKVDPSGAITTVAGGGNGCAGELDTIGDGCSATSGELYDPFGVAVDAAGNLYIADQFHHRIRMVRTDGIITTVAGSGVAGFAGDEGPATAAELNFPTHVAIDAAGNLYIADQFNQRIRKVDPAGTITTVAGSGVQGYGGDNGLATNAEFSGPVSVAVDNAGNLYVTDFNNSAIRKVDVTSSALAFAALAVGDTSGPQSVAVADVGNAPLNFSAIGASSNFTLQGAGNDCAAGTPLPIGGTCALGVAFTPAVGGDPLIGAVTVASDAFNSPGTVSLTGAAGYGVCPLYDQTRAVKSGASFQIKLYLCSTGGADVSSPAVVLHAVGVFQQSASYGEPAEPGKSNPDYDFRFDSTLGPAGGYIFNFKTTGLGPGTYSLQFTAGADPAPHALNFGVR